MTSKIKPADLETIVYKVTGGGYFEGGKPSPYGGPGIRTSNMPRAEEGGAYHKESDVDKHFVQGFNPLSFSLRPVKEVGDPEVMDFGPAGVTDNIIYLPYYTNNIASTVIPTHDESVCYFITDELSGCNFYIDKLLDGNLVCYHANAKRYSPTKDEVKANAGAFNPRAVDTMNEQHSNALESKYRGAERVAELHKAHYFAKAKAEVDQKVLEGCTDVEFYGGTTIMGFRVADEWEFWFQTYAQYPRRSAPTSSLGGLIRGEGKEVKVGEEKNQIIEARRFWPA